MESYNEAGRDSRTSFNEALETKMAELAKTKEEINGARDSAMQSWLDSRPLIDELENLQSDLKNAKNRASMATIVTSELESQLESTNSSIRSKKEEELKARKTTEELRMALDGTCAEMEKLKLETDQERRARARLKQELRLRRQTLRTLQLTLRAVRIESEALGASAADALHHIKYSNTDNTTVQLTHEEYNALTRTANEEITLAEWRVSVSMEQRLTAETSQNEALRRLKELYADNKSRKRDMEQDTIIERGEQEIIKEAEQEDLRTREQARSNKINSLQSNMVSATDRGSPRQRLRRSRSHHKKKMVQKKKISILHQIRNFLVRNITRLFG